MQIQFYPELNNGAAIPLVGTVPEPGAHRREQAYAHIQFFPELNDGAAIPLVGTVPEPAPTSCWHT